MKKQTKIVIVDRDWLLSTMIKMVNQEQLSLILFVFFIYDQNDHFKIWSTVGAYF